MFDATLALGSQFVARGRGNLWQNVVINWKLVEKGLRLDATSSSSGSITLLGGAAESPEAWRLVDS